MKYDDIIIGGGLGGLVAINMQGFRHYYVTIFRRRRVDRGQ